MHRYQHCHPRGNVSAIHHSSRNTWNTMYATLPFRVLLSFAAYRTPFYQQGAGGWTANGANANLAFGSVRTSCSVGSNSFVHELGHIMGFQHNRRAVRWDFLWSVAYDVFCRYTFTVHKLLTFVPNIFVRRFLLLLYRLCVLKLGFALIWYLTTILRVCVLKLRFALIWFDNNPNFWCHLCRSHEFVLSSEVFQWTVEMPSVVLET